MLQIEKFIETMKQKRVLGWLLALGTIVLTTQCGGDPEDVNSEELITTVRINFTDNQNANNTASALFQDMDGAGGNNPTITGPTLSANTTYTATVEFLDESGETAEDITAEVEDEGAEHQVFYTVAGGLNASVVYGDEDTNGNPVGLVAEVTTGDASTGTLTITLRHEPNKMGTGVPEGDITNAGGETDVEVSFDVTIQ